MRRIKGYISSRLSGIFPADEIRIISRALCEALPGIGDNDFWLEPQLDSDESRDRLLEEWTARIAAGEPMQYVTGWEEFCGIRIRCDRRALIPRPETTELVEWVMEECGSDGALTDIGTGTGCIAIALASKLPEWKVSAVDISENALALARENSTANDVKIDFFLRDILAPSDCDDLPMADVIVSNPPYIADCERQEMDRNVLDWEPHTALFVPDDDPLRFYRAIVGYGRSHLRPGGAVYLEINPLFASQLKILLEEAGCRVTFRNDISGRCRMAKFQYL